MNCLPVRFLALISKASEITSKCADDQKSESDACARKHVGLWGALCILGGMFTVSSREAADNACCDKHFKVAAADCCVEAEHSDSRPCVQSHA